MTNNHSANRNKKDDIIANIVTMLGVCGWFRSNFGRHPMCLHGGDQFVGPMNYKDGGSAK
jgi:hypothetical protein